MSKLSLVRAASLWCTALCLSACIFSESAIERDPRVPIDDLDMSASDQGGGLDLDAPDLQVADQGGSDLDAPDQGVSDMDMSCTAAGDEQLCGRAGRQCGPFTATDCGVMREIQCGACQQGECLADGTCSVCQPETDVQLCARLGAQCGSRSATDNCGNERTLDCGACQGAGEQCSEGGLCKCEPETNEQLCGAAGRQCGALSATDRCGATRQLDCGVCAQGECQTDGTCSVCQPETNGAFCARTGATCGNKTALDNCGNSRTVSNCGSCGADEACSANQCVCQPAECPAGATCGSVTNACNNTVQCGQSCAPGQLCNAQNACVCPPAPACPQGAQCGFTSNACGNMRPCGPNNGVCGANQACSNNQCVSSCTPESNAAFCLRTGATCGQKIGTDNCGQPRTASCGTCQAPQTCSVSNVCVCQPETNSQFCQRLGAQCGVKSGTDLCGNARTVDCGQCAGGSLRCANNMCSMDTPDMGGDMGDMGDMGCVAETDAQICQRLNIPCGTRDNVTDLCGKPRCVDCGDPCGLNSYCCNNACTPSGQLCGGVPVLCGVTD